MMGCFVPDYGSIKFFLSIAAMELPCGMGFRKMASRSSRPGWNGWNRSIVVIVTHLSIAAQPGRATIMRSVLIKYSILFGLLWKVKVSKMKGEIDRSHALLISRQEGQIKLLFFPLSSVPPATYSRICCVTSEGGSYPKGCWLRFDMVSWYRYQGSVWLGWTHIGQKSKYTLYLLAIILSWNRIKIDGVLSLFMVLFVPARFVGLFAALWTRPCPRVALGPSILP